MCEGLKHLLYHILALTEQEGKHDKEIRGNVYIGVLSQLNFKD